MSNKRERHSMIDCKEVNEEKSENNSPHIRQNTRIYSKK